MVSSLAGSSSSVGIAKALCVLAFAIMLFGVDKSNARKLPLGITFERDGTHLEQEVLEAKHQDLRRLTQATSTPTRSFVCAHCQPARFCRQQGVSWCQR